MTARGRFPVALVVLCLIATLAGGPRAGAETRSDRIRWKTTSLAPKDVGYAVYVRQILFPALSQACEGNLVITASWGGVMGDDITALKNLKLGRVQAAGLSGQGTYTACPEVAVLGLPFLLNGYDEVDYLKEKMIGTFDRMLEPRGLKLLDWLDQGFDEIYSTRRLETLEDFKGVRFASWFGPLETKLFASLDARAVPLDATAIPAALRQGKADAVVAPSIWVVGTQLHSVFKYVNAVKIRYTPAFFVASLDSFRALPERYQRNIEAVRLAKAKEFNVMARKDLDKFLDAIVGYGVKKARPSEDDIVDIRRRTTPLWYDLAGELYPESLLDEVLDHLADYRTAHPSQGGLAVAGKPSESSRPASAGGDKARQVISVQARLKALGYYPSPPDGVAGPVTYRAIKTYQRDKGLKPTGRVDAILLKSLGID